MMHARPQLGSRSALWIALGALLIGYVSTLTLATAGAMYRWVDEQGRVHLTDTPPKSKGSLQDLKIYQPSERDPAPQRSDRPLSEPGMVKLTPTKPGGTIVVEAVLSRRLTVPMLLDTGAD